MGRTELPPDDDRIVDLVLGLLDDEEREALRERIAADPEREKALRAQALAMEQARLDGPLPLPPEGTVEPRQHGDARTAGRPDGPPDSPGLRDRILDAIRNPRPPALIGFGLAVMLAALVFRAPAPRDGAPDGVIPLLPTGLETMRLRSGESMPEELENGIGAYGEDRLDAAIPLLESAETDGVLDLVRRAYLGSALARSERWEEAIVALDDVVERPLPDPWRTEARWARAVALRETGRIDEARAALESLAAENGPASQRAAEALERLPAP